MLDLLIKNGIAVDTDTGRETAVTVGVENGRLRILKKAGRGDGTETGTEAAAVLDAAGACLLPGLIDFHTHLFTRGSGFGVNADLLLSSGTTVAVDMGTAGCAGYEAFRQLDLLPRTIKIKSFLNLSPVGQPGAGISEPLSRSAVKEDEMAALFSRYPEEILGIKVRISRGIVGELGIAPLNHALELGSRFGVPVCVHTTDPPVSAEKIVECLRPGDIYSHMYHNKGFTILGEDGRVRPAFKKAQERGVFLEVGNGKMNFSFETAEKAIRDGVFPDIISSDATAKTYANSPDMKDLTFVMSKFLAMGMPLHRIFAAVTANPARCLRLEERGALRDGSPADLTILRLCDQGTQFTDSDGGVRTGGQVLVPEMTMIGGRIVYLQGRTGLGKG